MFSYVLQGFAVNRPVWDPHQSYPGPNNEYGVVLVVVAGDGLSIAKNNET